MASNSEITTVESHGLWKMTLGLGKFWEIFPRRFGENLIIEVKRASKYFWGKDVTQMEKCTWRHDIFLPFLHKALTAADKRGTSGTSFFLSSWLVKQLITMELKENFKWSSERCFPSSIHKGICQTVQKEKDASPIALLSSLVWIQLKLEGTIESWGLWYSTCTEKIDFKDLWNKRKMKWPQKRIPAGSGSANHSPDLLSYFYSFLALTLPKIFCQFFLWVKTVS